MSGFLETAFGPGAGAAQIAIVAAVLVALFVLAIWLFRRRGGGLGAMGSRQRQSRLAVTDMAVVDHKRRLVLVRRDNVEHLVMIGGAVDVVVEANIGRSRQRAGAGQRQAPAAAETIQRGEADSTGRLAERAAQAARAAQPQAAPVARDRLDWIAQHRPGGISDEELADDIMSEFDAGDDEPPEQLAEPPAERSAKAARSAQQAAATVAEAARPAEAPRPATAEAVRPEAAPKPQAPAQQPQAAHQQTASRSAPREPARQQPPPVEQPDQAGSTSAASLAAGVAALTAAVKMGRRQQQPDGDATAPQGGEQAPPRRAGGHPAQARAQRAAANDAAASQPRAEGDGPPRAAPDVIGEMRKAFGLRGKQQSADEAAAPSSPLAAKLQGGQPDQAVNAARQDRPDDHATAQAPVAAQAPGAAGGSPPDPFAMLDDVEPSEAALLRERLRQEGRRPAPDTISAAGSITTLGDLAERLEEALAKQTTGPRAKETGKASARPSPPPPPQAVAVAPEAVAANANGGAPPEIELDPPEETDGDPSVIDFTGRRKAGGNESLEDEMARLLGELTGDSAR